MKLRLSFCDSKGPAFLLLSNVCEYIGVLAGGPRGMVSRHVGFMDNNAIRISYSQLPNCRGCNSRGVGEISQNP